MRSKQPMLKTTLIALTNLNRSIKKDLMTAATESSFIVLPWHLDLNGHVNNATYLNFANKARIEFLAKHGLLKILIKNKVQSVIYKNEVLYKKPLNLFDTFQVTTTLVSLQKNEVLIKHQFSKKNIAVATCESHCKLLSSNNNIQIDSLVGILKQ